MYPSKTPGLLNAYNNPNVKIIAIYPLKALGREQEKRWREVFSLAGYNVSVGRIDGDVKNASKRKNILQSCSVVIMTPDIIHAWLLANINDKVIANFLLNIALFVIDEVHTYSGVFGSNAAYLFRRVRHLMALGGSYPHFICASATMANPKKHLLDLIGVNFLLSA